MASLYRTRIAVQSNSGDQQEPSKNTKLSSGVFTWRATMEEVITVIKIDLSYAYTSSLRDLTYDAKISDF